MASRESIRWPIIFVFPLLLPALWSLIQSAAQTRSLDVNPIVGLLGTTLALGIGSACLAVPCGWVLAIVLVRLGWPARLLLSLFLITLAFVPLAVQAGGWISVIGPYGWITPRDLGLGVSVRTGPAAAIAVMLIHALAFLPWVVGILAGSLAWHGIDIEEWALTFTGLPNVLTRVLLPVHRDATILSAFVVLAGVWSDMTVTDLFAIRTLAEEIYVEMEAGSIGTQGLPVVLVSMLTGVGISLLVSKAMVRELDRPASVGFASPWDVVGLARSHSAIAIQLLGISIMVLLTLPLLALGRQGFASFYPSGWSTTGGWGDVRLIGSSLFISSASGFVATLSATVLAWWYINESRPRRAGAIMIAMFAMMIPGPAIGLAIVEMLSRPSPGDLLGRFYDSALVIIWGQAARAWPWVFLVLAGAMSRYPKCRWELLYLEGASSWMRFRLGPLGELWNIVAGGFVLGTALCLGELATSKLIAPPGVELVSTTMFSLLHVGTTQAQARLGLMVWLVSALMVIAGWGMQRGKKKRQR
ncbi:hypothetical protein K2X85_10635 [bacterium]|nr:hypothetical protein [bacterium]